MFAELGSWALSFGFMIFLAWGIYRIFRWIFPVDELSAEEEREAEIAVVKAQYDSAVQRGDTAYADQLEAELRDLRSSGHRG